MVLFKSVTVSSENRRLMEDILKRSQDNQDQMSSRVTALLAGSSLTTTAGVRIDRRDTIDQIDYTAVGEQILFFLKSVQVTIRLDIFSIFSFLFFLPQRYTSSQIGLSLLSRFCFLHSVEIIDKGEVDGTSSKRGCTIELFKHTSA